jgi:hypothetical protein
MLTNLFDILNAGPPSAVELEACVGAQATDRMVAGPNLDHPSWAPWVNGADTVYLTLDGDLVGAQVYEDSRGWGAYVELVIRQGTLADVESVTGPTQWMPRAPDDFTSGQKVAAYVERAGWTVRIFVELARDDTSVHHVTLSYPSRDTPARVGPVPTIVLPRPPQQGTKEPQTKQSEQVELKRPHPGLPQPPPSPRPPSTAEPGDRCPTCGAGNAPGATFCGSCGAFLEWSR